MNVLGIYGRWDFNACVPACSRSDYGRRAAQGHWPEGASQVSLTITVMVPAYNEAVDIANTIDGLLAQTRLPDQILVVDDCSTDGTGDIARQFAGVDVVCPDVNCGSKAKAQNWGMQFVTGDLVLPVDGDTVLAENYIELLVREFEQDDNVAIAAGCVLTQRTETIWEKGRNVEYLFGFHWYRIIQNMANSPTVCSGCCTVFRTHVVRDAGGFPERTMVEDIDFTWSRQIEGHRAVYVAEAVAYAAEPNSRKYLCEQLKRWKSGWFQNVRLHSVQLMQRKPMLALWVFVSLIEIFISPFMLALPLMLIHDGLPLWMIPVLMVVGELLVFFPPILYGCIKRGIPWWKAFAWYPSFWVLKLHNFYYDMRCGFVELVLVPLGISKGLTVYVRGKA